MTDEYVLKGINAKYALNGISDETCQADDAGVAALERAAALARDYHPLPEFTDALLGLIAKAAIGLIGGPISDQHELLLTIAKLARRK